MGKIFERTLAIIEENKKRLESGELNCIPMPFERFSAVIPGIEAGRYVIVTASSGIGKSSFVKYMYVINAYEQYMKYPDSFNLKIFYFCLEESKESLMSSLISYKLFMDHGLLVPNSDLQSKRYAIPDEVIGYIQSQSFRDYFDGLEEVLEVVDFLRKPYSMYKYVQDYLDSHGTWTYRDYIDPQGNKARAHDYYTHNLPNMYAIVIVDHVSLLSQESKMTLHETITKFSSQYCTKLRDHYNCCIVIVQQQAADKEKPVYNLMKGTSIAEKLEPSLDGLGDNKLTQRDADLVPRFAHADRRSHSLSDLPRRWRGLPLVRLWLRVGERRAEPRQRSRHG